MAPPPCAPRAHRTIFCQASAETHRSLFRLCSPCHAGCESRCRGTRALRPRPEVLWRHDQRPHERQISRRPFLDPFWERAAAFGAPIYLHPADPVAPLPALPVTRAGAADVGLGRGDRLACPAHHLRRRFRPYPESKARARPSRRDIAVPALALRQPLGALSAGNCRSRRRIPQGERLGDDLGHVRSPAGRAARSTRWAAIA